MCTVGLIGGSNMVKNPKFAQVLYDASKTDTRVGFSKNILPFCTLIVAEHGRSKKKYYMLQLTEGEFGWKYVKRVKLENLDYEYVMKVIKKEYPDFMKKYAEYLINKNLEG